MPPTFLDKILHVITNSGPIGFALAFAASVIFALRYFKPEAVSFIDPSQLGYMFYVGLFGAGLVLLKFLTWLNKQRKRFWEYLQQQNRYVTAADRMHELLPDEAKAVCWMLINDRTSVIGNQYEDQFITGLLRKGFLVTTDGKTARQVFRLHPYVRSKHESILFDLPDKLRKSLIDSPAPWETPPPPRRGSMRI
jgi:hypothetical protein